MEAILEANSLSPHRPNDDDEASTTEHEETLPFALTPNAPHKTLDPILHRDPSSPIVVTPPHCRTTVHSSSKLQSYDDYYNCHPPALALSVISSPTEDGESQASLSAGDSSLFMPQPDSLYLDAAASLLLPNSSLVMASGSAGSHDFSSLTWAAGGASHEVSSSVSSSSSRIDDVGGGNLSQLLNQADDRHEFRHRSRLASVSSPRRPLPVLPEEQPVVSPTAWAPIWSSRSSDTSPSQWGATSFSLMSSQQTIVAAGHEGISTDHRMAALAGATATRTSNTSFTVAVDLSSSSSSFASLDESSAMNHVMNVVGNPDWLPLWCDAIPSLVITSSSEGARHSTSAPTEEQGRQYDGEWIEATTTRPLVSPHNTSCLCHSTRAVQAALGFPLYGKIDMFVERHIGQVGLTIGPFVGGVTVSHKLVIESYSPTRVRIVDKVQLKRGDGTATESSLCGLWEAMSSVFLPSVDDYMDQVLSSMARLRFLVEQGETVRTPPLEYEPPCLEESDVSLPLLDAIHAA